MGREMLLVELDWSRPGNCSVEVSHVGGRTGHRSQDWEAGAGQASQDSEMSRTCPEHQPEYCFGEVIPQSPGQWGPDVSPPGLVVWLKCMAKSPFPSVPCQFLACGSCSPCALQRWPCGPGVPAGCDCIWVRTTHMCPSPWRRRQAGVTLVYVCSRCGNT